LRYQQIENRNACYNSAFDIWQRGTSFATTGATSQYSADRWQIYSATGEKTFSRQSAGSLGTTPAQVAQYCMRIARDSGSTTTEAVYLIQSLETLDSLPYMGKTVTLSFYARKGANYSATSSALTAAITTGTGTDQNQLSFTGYAEAVNTTFTLTSSWQRFSTTVTLSASPTELGWRVYWTPTGTAGAADYAEVTGVKFELGSVPSTFNRQNATLQGELAACQRYYERWTPGASNFAFAGFNNSTTSAYHTWHYQVRKRVGATVSVSAAGDFSVRTPAGNQTCSAFSTIGQTIDGTWINTTSVSLGSGDGNFLVNTGVSPFIQADAEL
jgi:hypothetical protein